MADADYVLYVAADGSSPCASQSESAQIIAFAAHCQMEPELDRLVRRTTCHGHPSTCIHLALHSTDWAHTHTLNLLPLHTYMELPHLIPVTT